MSDLQVTNVFADGDTVSATNFNTNYSDIVTYINNRNSGSSTWDSFYSSHATNIPLVVNNSTGTQAVLQMNDNGTTVFEILDGGYVNAPLQDYAKAAFNKFVDGVIAVSATENITSGGNASVISQTHSSMDPTTGKFTASVSGKYFVSGRLRVSTSTPITGTVTMSIKKNGSTYSSIVIDASCGASGSLFPFSIDVVDMSVNDYLELEITNNATFTLSAPDTSSSENTRLFVYKLA